MGYAFGQKGMIRGLVATVGVLWWIGMVGGCTDQPPPKLPGDAWPAPGSSGASGSKSPDSLRKGRVDPQRFCELIALNPDRVEEFQKLHQKIPQAVRDAIHQKNIRNYSVFICSTREQVYAIRYYEYVGQEYAADMAELERHPDYKAWRNAWEECQVTLMPLSSGNWWAPSKEICHLE